MPDLEFVRLGVKKKCKDDTSVILVSAAIRELVSRPKTCWVGNEGILEFIRRESVVLRLELECAVVNLECVFNVRL